MDTTTLLIIILIIVLVGGGAGTVEGAGSRRHLIPSSL